MPLNTYKDLIESYKSTETRENQLWWLAILVILLMAIALYSVNAINMPDEWASNRIEFMLSTRVVRAGLILATLLICAYFRDNARRFRRVNEELIYKLSDNSDKLQQKHDELTRLKTVSDHLINITNLPDALNLVLNTAVETMEADKASIILRDKDSDIFRITASYGFEQNLADSIEIHSGEGIAGLVIESGEPIIINPDKLTDEIKNRITRSESLESSVVAPINLISGEVRGVISIAKNKCDEPVSEENLSLLMALANQVSLAIQKVELHNDLMNKVEMLAAIVTELKQTQAELIQAEKLTSIGRLAGGVAHEINNPLQTILGRTELLMDFETDELKIRDMESIIEHTNRIADIVSNLLSFSRQSNNTKFTNLNINDVIVKTIGLLEPQMNMDGMKVECNLADELPKVFGRAGQLQQIFTNMCLNAYQAMKAKPDGLLTITSKLQSDMINIEFKDNGPGIPSEIVEHLFEPFFTTKPEGEGTGLGLSIAYGIAQAHGGIIDVDSIPGDGACFTVLLPTVKEAPVCEPVHCDA